MDAEETGPLGGKEREGGRKNQWVGRKGAGGASEREGAGMQCSVMSKLGLDTGRLGLLTEGRAWLCMAGRMWAGVLAERVRGNANGRR